MSKYPGRIVTDLAPAGYSVFFDGSGDWLETPNNSTLALGSSDFSVEWWEYRTTLAAEDTAIQAAGTYGFYFNYYDTGFPRFFLSTSSGSWNVFNNAATGAISANTWNHFVVTRSGTAFRVFLNGVLSIYATGSGSVVQPNNNFLISGNAAQSYFPGYISNVRVVKGSIPTPYQTSSTTTNTTVFTPPTQVLNSTDTILLTCNSPAIIDQSNNAFAITVNGNSAVSTFTPFTAYVPYNPALGASTPGVWTLDEALQAKGTRQWNMYDPRFNLTTLLLHGNGTNTAQNNTFLDSSSNNFSITRNGNTTQGTFTPFSQSPGRWSNYFDGSGDYLVTPSNSAFDPSGQNITVDFWVYLTRYATTTGAVFEVGSAAVGDMQCLIGNTGYVAFQIGGTAGSSVNGFTLNTWHYVTCVKSGTNFTAYLNGVAGTTVSMSPNSKTTLTIGAQGNGANAIDGYISNFRYVRGSANIPTSIPNAPLTNITNTSLLTCQSNRFVDNGTANSGSGFALTVNGNPSIQPFSPFYPTAAYTPATVGGSGYFDGTGDFLSNTNTLSFTGQFSCEAWFYRTLSGGSQRTIFSLNQSANNGFGSVRIDTDSGNVGLNITASIGTTGTSWAANISFNNGYVVNTWNHVLVTRDASNVCRLFINGVLQGSATVAGTLYSALNNHLIGANYSAGPTAGNFFQGYIGDTRIINGSIPTTYQTSSTTSGTSIFTPPTAPLTTTSQGATSSNVFLLCNYTNAGIFDSTAKNVLETVGNAQISTTQSKFGGTSMSFDGTGDYLVFPANPLYAFGTGDFTVEAWVYPTSNAAVLNICGTRTSAGTVNGWNWGILTNGSSQMYSNSAIANTGASTVPLNTWTHLAFVRTGGTIYGYVNGVQKGSTANTENFTINTFWVGITGGTAEPFFGYIDELRITRFARYTGNFTPQTSQWQDE